MGLLNLFKQNSTASISGSQLKDMLESENAPILLDVRSPQEYLLGHIPGSANIPVQSLSDIVQQNSIHIDKPLVLYCQSGARSAHACGILKSMGYSEVYNFGGLHNWSYGFEK